jgi:hypothetical protein
MQLKSLDIKYYLANKLHSQCEGITHIKALRYLSVVQSLEGSYDVKLGSGKLSHTEKNGVFIAPPTVMQTLTHHVDSTSGFMTAHWLFLDVTVNGAYSLDRIFDFPVLLPSQYQNEVSEIISNVINSKGL